MMKSQGAYQEGNEETGKGKKVLSLLERSRGKAVWPESRNRNIWRKPAQQELKPCGGDAAATTANATQGRETEEVECGLFPHWALRFSTVSFTGLLEIQETRELENIGLWVIAQGREGQKMHLKENRKVTYIPSFRPSPSCVPHSILSGKLL